MVSVLTPLIALVCMGAGMLMGSYLRRWLPDHHLRDESRDVVTTAAGMIATLVALVIGLLVSSATSSFDQANAGITQTGQKDHRFLDRLLRPLTRVETRRRSARADAEGGRDRYPAHLANGLGLRAGAWPRSRGRRAWMISWK